MKIPEKKRRSGGGGAIEKGWCHIVFDEEGGGEGEEGRGDKKCSTRVEEGGGLCSCLCGGMNESSEKASYIGWLKKIGGKFLFKTAQEVWGACCPQESFKIDGTDR